MLSLTALLFSIHSQTPEVAIVFTFGVLAFSIFLGIVTFSEALILYGMKYGSLKRSVAASLIINIVSSTLGFVAIFLIQSPDMTEVFLQIGSFVLLLNYPDQFKVSMILLPLFVAFPISVISEGMILVILQKTHPAETIWRMTLIANLVSYVLLFVLYMGAFYYLQLPS